MEYLNNDKTVIFIVISSDLLFYSYIIRKENILPISSFLFKKGFKVKLINNLTSSIRNLYLLRAEYKIFNLNIQC